MEINYSNSDDNYLTSNLVLRDYQRQIIDKAVKENSIVFLPTGSGKTLISVHVLLSRKTELIKHYMEGGKRAIFLTTTKLMAYQISKNLRESTKFSVGCYTGDMNVDFWDRNKWQEEIKLNHVLVTVGEIFRVILERELLTGQNISLLVMDECHHAVNQHPYSMILKKLFPCQDLLILGLTATLFISDVKPNNAVEEMRNLEEKFKAKVISVPDLKDISGFSANPQIIYVTYDVEASWNISSALKVYEDLLQNLNKVEERYEEFEIPSDGIPFKNSNYAKSFKKLIDNSFNHLKNFGPFIGSLAALYLIIVFEKKYLLSKNINEGNLLIYIVTELNKVRYFLLRTIGSESPITIYQNLSDKVKKLLNTLKTCNSSSEQLSCIIFVQQKITAIVFSALLKILSSLDNEYSFMKAEFVTGTSVFEKEFYSFNNKNDTIVQWFNSQKINILIATEVLEEGIDITHCNNVISFDFPKTFSSYIQGKGRCRNKGGQYYVLLEKNDRNEKKLKTYETQLEMLYDIVTKGDEEESEVNLNADSSDVESINIAVDSNKTINVTGQTAITIVHKYCASLPGDQFSVLLPISWYIKNNTMKKAFLRLPSSSPCSKILEGDLKHNSRQAKKNVFLKTVQELHSLGELDSELNPNVSKKLKDYDYLFPEDDGKEGKGLPSSGTKKSIREYDVKFAECLVGCMPTPGEISYLHVFELTVSNEKPTSFRGSALYNLLSSSVTYAILSKKKLCKICSFPLFIDFVELNCNILPNHKTCTLDQDELNDIKLFHYSLFNKVLQVTKEVQIYDNRNKQFSFFIVPVEKESDEYFIDWNLIRSDFCKESALAVVRYNPSEHTSVSDDCEDDDENIFISNKLMKNNFEEMSRSLVSKNSVLNSMQWENLFRKHKTSTNNFVMNEADYKYFVITPYYRNCEQMCSYIVVQICRDLTPLSPFPNEKYENYYSYFKERYNKEITNFSQPLLLVRTVPRCCNFNRPPNNKEFDEHFIPELCKVIPFLSKYWVKGLLLPTILNRIIHIYHVEEFRRKIVEETEIGISNLPCNLFWSPLKVCTNFTTDDEDTVDNHYSLSTIKYPEIIPRIFRKYSEEDDETIFDPERVLLEVAPCDLKNLTLKVLEIKPEEEYSLANPRPREIKVPDVEIPQIKILNAQPCVKGPELATLVQACTAKSANDIVNYERLEILGDSFLKLAASVFFFRNSDLHEGDLTLLKGKLVSNKNLYKLAIKKDLQSILNVTDFTPTYWDPPLFCVPEKILECVMKHEADTNDLGKLKFSDKERFSGVLSELTYRKSESKIANFDKSIERPRNTIVPYKMIRDKAIADCVEAFLGAYLESSGLFGGFEILVWLGILPKTTGTYKNVFGKLYKELELKEDLMVAAKQILNQVFYEELENTLGYCFNNKALLLEALTHPSYQKNHITKSYQRLEFLGDAILDFLVTCYLYEKFGSLSPGQLSDIRMSLVNNIAFGCLSVRYEFHKYLLYMNNNLGSVIQRFNNFQTKRNHVIDENVLLIAEENISVKNVDFRADYAEVPKALGDVFEAIAGAIFLDSNNSLETVWNVYYKLMKTELDEFSKKPPISSVRMLHELCSGDVKFHYAEKETGVEVKCYCKYNNESFEVVGFGPNKKITKHCVAKLVVKKILQYKTDN